MGYREGDWFAVPLPAGGHAPGLVARARRHGVLLGYFFGPRRAVLPSVGDAQGLRPGDAVLVGHFEHLGLKRGERPVLGRLDGWDRSAWPMPAFVRFEKLTGRTLMVVYDDDDPGSVIREHVVPAGTTVEVPADGMMGPGFVEHRLGRLL